jgi:hypothetical protein
MKGPPIYEVEETGQMSEVGASRPFKLEIHELRDDGQPRCGPKPDSWRRKPMRLVELGREWVTCKSCARITGH